MPERGTAGERPGTDGTRAGPPAWIAPQLATLTQDRFSRAGWIFERKLDGERCLALHDGRGLRLMTRNQKPVTAT
jgi:bifunctional non-homologous end joining protein LigD